MAFSKTGGIAAGASANAASPVGLSKGGTGPGGWEPTVLWLMGLCILEIFAVAILSAVLLRRS
jgi:hypothetical protein